MSSSRRNQHRQRAGRNSPTNNRKTGMHREQNIIFTRNRNWLYSKWQNIFPFYLVYTVYASLLFMFVLRLNVTRLLNQVRRSFKWFSCILNFRTFHLLVRNSYVLQKLANWRTLKKYQGKYCAGIGFSWSQWKHRCSLRKFVLTASIFKWIKKSWVTNYEFQVASYAIQIEKQELKFKSMVQIHEFKFT